MSFFSTKNFGGVLNSVTSEIAKAVETETYNDENSKSTFFGVNAPLIGRYGLTIRTGGIADGNFLKFGRFKDPRVALRDKRDNKIVIPPDSGTKANKPIPSTRGGVLASVDLSFDELKKKLTEDQTLFEDPEFPATDSSLYFSQRLPKNIEWRRPNELCSNPQFFSGGASRFDVRQGELGDCWLLAAIACLSLHDDLFEQVVPQDQGFDSNYCGLFRFHFWRFGEWKEVIVDDRLPTYRGSLVFIHSTERNEFWSALLEKAYAKLCGSYEALKGGTTIEALEDFTGGIGELFDLKGDTKPDLLSIMLKSEKLCSLMACSIQADPRQLEARLSNGLIMGHAYSITSIKMCDISVQGKTGKIPLVRIRNPWGNEAEWTGAWSDKSREWTLLSAEERENLGLVFDDDGEFWMSFQDFTSNFEKLEICHLGPQSLTGGENSKRVWEMSMENSSWQPRVSAGGCRNFLETFWINPQFMIDVEDPDEDDDENKGTVIIGLIQKDRRKMRNIGAELLTMGYAIYKLPPNVEGTLDMKFFKYNSSTARSPSFINLREICGRHKLDPGRYVIIPSTFEPGQPGEFMLRIFSEKAKPTEELDEATDITDTPENLLKTTSNIVAPLTDDQVEALKRAFTKVAGEDGEIDCEELRDILNVVFTQNFNFDGFTLESCRSMISMMDSAFKLFDADQSGCMNSFELRNALKHVGFRINNSIFSTLVMRFARRDGSLPFDNYVICCARLRTLFEIHRSSLKNENGEAMFSESEFVNTVLYM